MSEHWQSRSAQHQHLGAGRQRRRRTLLGVDVWPFTVGALAGIVLLAAPTLLELLGQI